MSAKASLGILAVILGIVLCTFLPFLPGRYELLAEPVSVLAQVFGMLGLLLVPAGLLWSVSLASERLAGKRPLFAVVALVVFGLVWAALTLAASALGGFMLGAATLAFGLVGVRHAIKRVRASTDVTRGIARPIAIGMVVVPLAVLGLQSVLAETMTEFSRHRAMRNSAPMIAAIERYRAVHGRYPVSLRALWPDYLPGMIGIAAYHYEPSEEAYNLFFEHPNFHFGMREIVMFNPRDRHAFTCHARDILELTPAELALDQQRGYYAVHAAGYPHWKFFWFD